MVENFRKNLSGVGTLVNQGCMNFTRKLHQLRMNYLKITPPKIQAILTDIGGKWYVNRLQTKPSPRKIHI